MNNNNVQIDQIVAIVTNNLPVVAAMGGVVVVETLLRQVRDIIRTHQHQILALLQNALIYGGLAVLVPALTVALVNAIGFTVGGVAAGSLAALIQSVFYGPLTGGLFAALQSFGAVATIAPPIALALGGGAAAAGVWLAINKRMPGDIYVWADKEAFKIVVVAQRNLCDTWFPASTWADSG